MDDDDLGDRAASASLKAQGDRQGLLSVALATSTKYRMELRSTGKETLKFQTLNIKPAKNKQTKNAEALDRFTNLR